MQHALTYGLERSYEAVLSSPFASDPQRGYDTLSHFDYIFDNQKNQALRKFWDSGVKVAREPIPAEEVSGPRPPLHYGFENFTESDL